MNFWGMSRLVGQRPPRAADCSFPEVQPEETDVSLHTTYVVNRDDSPKLTHSLVSPSGLSGSYLYSCEDGGSKRPMDKMEDAEAALAQDVPHW